MSYPCWQPLPRTKTDPTTIDEAIAAAVAADWHAGVVVFNSADIGIPTSVWTPLTFNSEWIDDAGFHSVVENTGWLTVPVGYDGWYVISGHVAWTASAAGTMRGVLINVVGSYSIAVQACSAAMNYEYQSVSTVYYLMADQSIELMCYQDTGADLNVMAATYHSPEFRMMRAR